MPNNGLLFFKPFFQDYRGHTTLPLYTVDNDVVIGLVIDSPPPPANIMSMFRYCFLQSPHNVHSRVH